ncbi:thioredoxin domain-containing protein [Clostridium estertheticum]|uniref:thioredoxin domain-containing protein n=1 Tax=Clostridium estertheticum TaxID=238834 RepID=UPI001C7DF0B6|nr:DUF6568 family protein [Clostridium estertheticum]MBX4268548.1 hypothetical protein [Clostridium estertheticum]WLC81392.1 hypothetical protein KTC98_09355 [Clostridium estertheticum]
MIKKKVLKTCIIIIVMILGIGSFYLARVHGNSKENNEIPTTSKVKILLDINKESLAEKIENKESFLVYIGRPSCPDCRKFTPKLEKKLTDTNKQILYYNTEVHASKKQEMRVYLNSLGIKSVPTIMGVSKGNVEKVYDCSVESQSEEIMNTLGGKIK